MRRISGFWVSIAFALAVHAQGRMVDDQHAAPHPVSVADSIEMTQVGFFDADDVPPAVFSPDGKKFLILTHRGNLQTNTNESSLLLFHSEDALRSPHPELLLTLSSSSNSPAIWNTRWMADNETIVFLGQKLGYKQEIYSLNVNTHKLILLTRHPTDILAFDITSDLRTMAYIARRPVVSVLDKNAQERGLLITTQNLWDLASGTESDNEFLYPLELFLMDNRNEPLKVSFHGGEHPLWQTGIKMSPDGRYLALAADFYPSDAPASWSTCENPHGIFVWAGFRLVDIFTAGVRPVVDAPLYSFSFAWSSDSKSLVLGGVDVPPCDSTNASHKRWAVEVGVPDLNLAKISEGEYELFKLDSVNHTVILKPSQNADATGKESPQDLVAFKKEGGQWARIDPAIANAGTGSEPEIRQVQDMNTPPRLFAVNPKTGAESLLLDLNPKFRDLTFGHVEKITWKGTDGVETRGGLYLPPDFLPGRKYPLVIQTHGWNAMRFEIDGPYTSGYAAQALANSGFLVAQIPENIDDVESTQQEGPRGMAMFQGLIDELDRRGILDRDRVGLLGFSRTGYAVRYTLAFSKHRFAAVAIVDGNDFGYWQYISTANMGGTQRDTPEAQNGAPPFGRGLQNWLDHTPSFNLDRMQTPVRLLGFGRYAFTINWEQFVGLRRLAKPVELIWLPDALHEVVKPHERMTVQQGNVDWFRFWLQNYEDPDPAKAEQYKRWRQLKKLQEEGEKKARDNQSQVTSGQW